MKFKILLTTLLLLTLQALTFAQTNRNLATTKVGGGGATSDFIIYTVDLIHTGAATDTVFSKAINLDNLEILSIHLRSIGVTTRDVNIGLQGSNSLTDNRFVDSQYTRTLALNGDLDDLSPDAGNTTIVFNPWIYQITYTATGVEAAAAVIDINTVRDPATMLRYFRLYSSGETGNLVTSNTIATILCRKIKLTGHGRSGYAAQSTK